MYPALFPADLDYIAQHTREVWRELNNKRLFITGGTGFFGVWLLESLLWAQSLFKLNMEVVLLTRNPAAFASKLPLIANHSTVQLLQGDVRTFTPPSGTFTHIIHAATEASAVLNANHPMMMFDTIVDGTRQVLEFARQSGAEKILLTSSGAVYGTQPPEMSHIKETYLGAPSIEDLSAAYAHGKRAAEHLCFQYARKCELSIKIARCFAFVGPHLPLDQHFAIGNFMRDVLYQKPISINGDGAPYRSYLYAADLTIWLWNILCFGKSCYPYNVGSDEAVSIVELARLVTDAASVPVPINVAKTPDPLVLPARYVPDVTRARQELALPAGVPLREAIKRTIQWHQQKNQSMMMKETMYS